MKGDRARVAAWDDTDNRMVEMEGWMDLQDLPGFTVTIYDWNDHIRRANASRNR